MHRQSRYPTIDFLRGLAIFIMLILHQINFVLDIPTMVDHMDSYPMLNMVILVCLPFLGGLAGLFLMVSAIGNMISIQKKIQKGMPLHQVVFRQVISGLLIVLFGMLSEGVIGYNGVLGNFFRNLHNLPAWFNGEWYSTALWRCWHFETIHTIGWCVIVNGLVHGAIYAWKRDKSAVSIIKTYAVLIVAVLALTPLLWYLVDQLYPGFPFAQNEATGHWVMYPVFGISPFKDFIILFFLNPIAGHPEPIFPYLAVSFIGSIVGVYLSQDREAINRQFVVSLLKIGLAMFIVGLIGTAANLVILMMDDFNGALMFYKEIWDHRAWTQALSGVPFLGWLFQFLLLNGFALCCVAMLLRVIEFRGKAQSFAQKTAFIRRFGYVAFSVYNNQWLYFITWYLFTLAIGGDPYQHFLWGGTVIDIVLGIIFFWAVLRLWEKIGYVGSIEWTIGLIASKVFGISKANTTVRASAQDGGDTLAKLPWYRRWGGLNVEGTFYSPNWLDVVKEPEIDHSQLAETQLAKKLAGVGFVFFPFSFISLGMGLRSQATEGKHKFNRKAIRRSILSIALVGIWGLFFSFFSLLSFGISF